MSRLEPSTPRTASERPNNSPTELPCILSLNIHSNLFCLGFDDLVHLMCSTEIQLILQDRGFQSMTVQAGKTKVGLFYSRLK